MQEMFLSAIYQNIEYLHLFEIQILDKQGILA